MVYHNSDPSQKAKFLARASYLAEKGKDVNLMELRPLSKRSLSQNSCWWAWCGIMADIVGDTPEAVARDVKREILGQKKVYNIFTGEESYEDYQTHLMTDEEMSELLSKTKQWAFSNYGWALPSRDDAGFEEMMSEYGTR